MYFFCRKYQATAVKRVVGIANTQYIQNLSEMAHPNSELLLKNDMLKIADTKVGGRNVSVTRAIDFMVRLSACVASPIFTDVLASCCATVLKASWISLSIRFSLEVDRELKLLM